MDRLRGRVAVVTGASEGIGEAIVRQLAAHGMKVAALARRMEMLKQLESDCKRKGHMVTGYVCDVQMESQVKAAFKSIQKDLGPVTVLINNAGILKATPLKDLNMDIVNDTFKTNVVGVLSCTKEGLASMTSSSVDHGHIININSVAGHKDIPHEDLAVYCASKRTITSLSESLRNECKLSKIRVTSISPGLVKTSLTKNFLDDEPRMSPLFPSDVVDAVMYALSAPHRVNVSDIILDNAWV